MLVPGKISEILTDGSPQINKSMPLYKSTYNNKKKIFVYHNPNASITYLLIHVFIYSFIYLFSSFMSLTGS